MKKYATFHLLILNEKKYIDGACISVSTYRRYGNKSIEHNCMIDNSISKKGIKKLEKFFDNIILIDLVNFKSDFNIGTSKSKERYRKWVNYALSKWLVLQFDMYEKILFCDIDTLAVYYYSKIFKMNTPAWTILHKTYFDDKNMSNFVNKIKTGDKLTDRIVKKIANYGKNTLCNKKRKPLFLPMNASIVLLKPSKIEFEKFFNFVLDQISKNKKITCISRFNFPDESTLFEYYHCYLNTDIYCIGPEYLVTEWRYKSPKKEINNVFCNVKKPIIFNYDSTDKPWLKSRKNMYDEELIWDDIRRKLKLSSKNK